MLFTVTISIVNVNLMAAFLSVKQIATILTKRKIKFAVIAIYHKENMTKFIRVLILIKIKMVKIQSTEWC